MTIVRHPTLSVEYDITGPKVPAWVAAGWIADPVEPSVVVDFATDGGQLARTETDTDAEEKPKPKPKPKTKKK